jgi:hypothetical protein
LRNAAAQVTIRPTADVVGKEQRRVLDKEMIPDAALHAGLVRWEKAKPTVNPTRRQSANRQPMPHRRVNRLAAFDLLVRDGNPRLA